MKGFAASTVGWARRGNSQSRASTAEQASALVWNTIYSRDAKIYNGPGIYVCASVYVPRPGQERERVSERGLQARSSVTARHYGATRPPLYMLRSSPELGYFSVR